jgi:hypothetical protein
MPFYVTDIPWFTAAKAIEQAAHPDENGPFTFIPPRA